MPSPFLITPPDLTLVTGTVISRQDKIVTDLKRLDFMSNVDSILSDVDPNEWNGSIVPVATGGEVSGDFIIGGRIQLDITLPRLLPSSAYSVANLSGAGTFINMLDGPLNIVLDVPFDISGDQLSLKYEIVLLDPAAQEHNLGGESFSTLATGYMIYEPNLDNQPL